MRPAALATLSVIALAAAVGPAAAATIVADSIESGYDRSEFVSIADGKPFKVEVLTADVGDRPLMEREILSSMQAAGVPGVRTTFVAGQPATSPNGSDYRLVVAVNPGGSTSAENLCAADAKVVPATTGRLHLVMSFCRTDELLSTATAITGASLQDPKALASTMSELMAVVLPATTPIRISHNHGMP